MNASERAATQVERLLHDAHLRYQRQQTAPDREHGTLPCPEVRGCRVDAKHHIRPLVMLPHYFTGLRPNFWRAYLETMVFMSSR